MELKYFKQISSVKDLNKRIEQYNLDTRKIGILSLFTIDDLPSNSIETKMYHYISWIVEENVHDTLTNKAVRVEEIVLFEYIEKRYELTFKERLEMENEGHVLEALFNSSFYKVNSPINQDVIDSFN